MRDTLRPCTATGILKQSKLVAFSLLGTFVLQALGCRADSPQGGAYSSENQSVPAATFKQDTALDDISDDLVVLDPPDGLHATKMPKQAHPSKNSKNGNEVNAAIDMIEKSSSQSIENLPVEQADPSNGNEVNLAIDIPEESSNQSVENLPVEQADPSNGDEVNPAIDIPEESTDPLGSENDESDHVANKSDTFIGLVIGYTSHTLELIQREFSNEADAVAEIERLIQERVDFTNLSYQLHDLPQRVYVAHIYQTAYIEPDISHCDQSGLENAAATNEVATCPGDAGHPYNPIRDYYSQFVDVSNPPETEGNKMLSGFGGDIYLLLPDNNRYNRTSCGFAAFDFSVNKAYMNYSIVNHCSDGLGGFAHEIGHAHGATHHQLYTFGHDPTDHIFGTIMGSARRLPMYSDASYSLGTDGDTPMGSTSIGRRLVGKNYGEWDDCTMDPNSLSNQESDGQTCDAINNIAHFKAKGPILANYRKLRRIVNISGTISLPNRIDPTEITVQLRNRSVATVSGGINPIYEPDIVLAKTDVVPNDSSKIGSFAITDIELDVGQWEIFVKKENPTPGQALIARIPIIISTSESSDITLPPVELIPTDYLPGRRMPLYLHQDNSIPYKTIGRYYVHDITDVKAVNSSNSNITISANDWEKPPRDGVFMLLPEGEWSIAATSTPSDNPDDSQTILDCIQSITDRYRGRFSINGAEAAYFSTAVKSHCDEMSTTISAIKDATREFDYWGTSLFIFFDPDNALNAERIRLKKYGNIDLAQSHTISVPTTEDLVNADDFKIMLYFRDSEVPCDDNKLLQQVPFPDRLCKKIVFEETTCTLKIQDNCPPEPNP